jgi:hypothetical protein
MQRSGRKAQVPFDHFRRTETEVRPSSYSTTSIQNRSLTILHPESEHTNGVGVVIARRGFTTSVFSLEGVQPVACSCKMSITAFVLKTRLSHEPGSEVTLEVSASEDRYRALSMIWT